jgi:hypothetical protein
MSNKEFQNRRSFPRVFLIIVLVILALSIVSLYNAANAYIQGDSSDGSYLLMVGLSALAMSAYMIFQNRKKTPRLIFKPIKVTTVTTCKKCEFKRIRNFKRGDYIFKEDEPCRQCDGNMLITSIYSEKIEKKKR